MTDEFNAVSEVISTYFDGLYHSDTNRLKRTFHPQATYVTGTGGDFLYRNMKDYFAVVDQRPSPASRNEPRRDAVRSIDFAGPETARAVVHCAIGERYFTDFLTFVKTDGEWRIISKVFHFDIVATA